MQRFRATRLLPSILVIQSCILSADIQGAEPDSLADDLVKVSCDVNSWDYFGRYAAAMQFGMKEAVLHDKWPNLSFRTLPEKVQRVLRSGHAGLAAWSTCIGDERPTRAVQVDMLRRPNPEAESVRVTELAAGVLLQLVPLGDLESADDLEQFLQLVRERAGRWVRESKGLTAKERMQKWFRQATARQRLSFMVLALEAEHAPAWPLIEADFLERAKEADDYLMMEVLAYCRHRRKDAMPLVNELKKRISSNELQIFEPIYEVLVGSQSFEEFLSATIRGEIERDQLEQLITFSIDMPWRTHSMKIEPTGMHRATLERQLEVLVVTANRLQKLDDRLSILSIANSRASDLHGVLQRSRSVYRKSTVPPDSPSRDTMVRQLVGLLGDHRQSHGEIYDTTSPSVETARLVWALWAPTDTEMDVLFRGAVRDWRTDVLESSDWVRDELIVEIASEILRKRKQLSAEPYPANEAKTLIDGFKKDPAADWRSQLAVLSLRQKMLFLSEYDRSPELAIQLEPLQVEWAEWSAPSDETRSFEPIWAALKKQQMIKEAGLDLIRDWLVTEWKSGRKWSLTVSSNPLKPGLTVSISQNGSTILPAFAADASAHPELVELTTVESLFRLGTRSTRFSDISNGKLVRWSDDEETEATRVRQTQLLKNATSAASVLRVGIACGCSFRR